ncbi:MAG TPA: hypothetical protein V6D47_07245 [Oscillatoriaceae cyanobacterium]
MLVESEDLVGPTTAAWTAGVALPVFQAWVQRGQIRPFVTIDGQSFYHKAEVLALRRFTETLAGKRPSAPPPRTQDLF